MTWNTSLGLVGLHPSVALPACAFFQCFMYATPWAFGPLSLAFVALNAASLAAIAWLVATVGVAALASLWLDLRMDRSLPAAADATASIR